MKLSGQDFWGRRDALQRVFTTIVLSLASGQSLIYDEHNNQY